MPMIDIVRPLIVNEEAVEAEESTSAPCKEVMTGNAPSTTAWPTLCQGHPEQLQHMETTLRDTNKLGAAQRRDAT